MQSIVNLEGLPAPQEVSSLFQTQINTYESVFGPNSDSQYLSTNVAEQQQSLLLYQNEAQNGQDSLLRSYASGSVTVLQGQLNQAQSLLSSTNSSGFG